MRTSPLILAVLLCGNAAAAPTDNEAHFRTLHALMQPRAEETAWLQIPWRTSLWEARIDAAKTGKPIYLWEMDGHPLGCT